VTLSLGDDPALAETINQRFAALFATNLLLTNSEDHTATLKEIIDVELECFGPTRIRASGPEVVLTANPAQALTLIIHELGTNAAKYGALSAVNGFVTIDWEVVDANVNLTWTERGGPAILPPSKLGFGTNLITSLLKPLNGSAKLDFYPTGLVCRACFSVKR
jgi:two-component sensor histidine kinase